MIVLITGLFCKRNTTSKQDRGSSSGPGQDVVHMIYGLWDTKPYPEYMVEHMNQWKNQGFEVKVWNKQMCETFLKEHSDPYWKILYDKLPRPVQRADLLRYLIVAEYGGIYADIDVEPILPMKKRWHHLSQSQSAWFFIEHVVTEEWSEFTARHFSCRQGIPENLVRLSNFAFASVPNHAIWPQILTLVKERCERLLNITTRPVNLSDYEILYSTGPDVISEIVSAEKKNMDQNFQPVVIDEADDFMIHQCKGAWRNHHDQHFLI